MPLRLLFILLGLTVAILPAAAEDDARTKQLRLLCAQLSGDLTEPGGLAAFRRCLTQDPLGEIRRDNNLPPAAASDRPGAAPPAGFGRDSRQSLASGVERFQTLDGKEFFVVDKDAKLWRGNPATKDPQVVAQHVATFRATGNALFVRDSDGKLWREGAGASPRILVDQAVAAFQPVNESLLYIQGMDGALWREAGNAATRAIVDRTVSAFQAVDASLVFVLGTDHRLWREIGDMHTRSLVASTVVAFQYVPDGDTVYVVTGDGGLWRQEGAGKAEPVDHDVAGFQAVDMHLAYVLGKDGRLWRELGNRDQAVLVDHHLPVASGKAAFQAIDAQHVYLLGEDHRLWGETMPAGR